MASKVIHLDRSHIEQAVDIFADAFTTDPLFEYIFSPSNQDYADCLREFFKFSCEVRYLLDWPMLGLQDDVGKIVGAAGVSLPGDTPWPQALTDIYRQLKEFTGPESAARFDKMAALADPLSPPQPFHELGVIGVLTGEQGHGYGGKLVQAVDQLSQDHPDSTGVYLWTQNPQNVTLYSRFGYNVTWKRAYSEKDKLYLWGMFRPNP